MAWNPVFTFPTGSGFVTTDTDQTGLSGDKEWLGEHTFNTAPKVVGGSSSIAYTASLTDQGVTVEYRYTNSPELDMMSMLTGQGLSVVGLNSGTSLTLFLPVNEVLDGAGHQQVSIPYKSGTVALLEDLTGLSVTWDNVADKPTSFPSSWADVSGKPSTFPPSAHTHAAGDVNSGTFANARISQGSVTQHQSALSINYNQITNAPQTFLRAEPSNKEGPSNYSINDESDLNDWSGAFFAYANSTVDNRPPMGNANILGWGLSNYQVQFGSRNDRLAFRNQEGGTWLDWRELYHSGNLDPSGFVATSGNQSGMSGNKGWTGTHTFATGNSSPPINVSRGNNAQNALYSATTTDGSVFFGQGILGNFSVGGTDSLHLAANNWMRVNADSVILTVSLSGTSATFSGSITSNNIVYGNSFRSNSGSADLSASSSNGGVRLMPNGYTTNGFTHITGNGNMSVSGEITANGNNIYVGPAGRLRSSSNQHVILSTTDGTIYFRPKGDASAEGQATISNNGNLQVDGTVTGTNLVGTNSDPRLKTNRRKIKARRALIEQLDYWAFEWIRDGKPGRSIMADKVQELAPEHVHVGDDEMGTLSVDKGALALEMVFALIDMLKEQDDGASE